MNRAELLSEIQNLLDQAPEQVLQEVLRYLQAHQDETVDAAKLAQNLAKILEEDRELLQQLAQ